MTRDDPPAGVRSVVLVVHTGRPHSTAHARTLARDLSKAGLQVRVAVEEAVALDLPDLPGVVPATDGPDAAAGAEVVLALGGDGTLLRAAELARPAGVPLLGINLGQVGFLAEAEVGDLDDVVAAVVERQDRKSVV